MVEYYKIDENNASGCCPECGHSWDKGDVMEYLESSFPTLNKEDLLKQAKRLYNWTPENPRRFSHLVFIEPSDGDMDFDGNSGYYQCPNCNIAWDSKDGKRTDKYCIMLIDDLKMNEFLKKITKKD